MSLDGENVVANLPDGSKQAFPLHTLESIVSFSYRGASPALMGKCVADGINMAFYSPQGRFLCSVGNETNGNVLLRRAQFRIADNEVSSLKIAANMISAKLYNAKFVLLRCVRDHRLQVDTEALRVAADRIHGYTADALAAGSMDSLRGIEGNASAEYFSVFNELILQNKDCFGFDGRNRRPPLDPINALLSFAYSLLSNECAYALRGVGLDPYVGFMHADRPGRKSLALDMVEELRPAYADRFVLFLINNRMLEPEDFETREGGAVLLTDKARKLFLAEWQKRKRETLTHPYLDEKVAWGLVPHVQALLLARTVRGDLEEYPPFFWK